MPPRVRSAIVTQTERVATESEDLMSRALSSTFAIATTIAAAGAGVSAHVPLRPPGSIKLVVTLNVGGAAYSASGPGECNYAADASIHQAPARMWSVRQRDPNQDLNFTMWNLKNGGEMFTLSMISGGKTHRVNTLTVGPAGDRRGSGNASFAPLGKSGRFTIDAVADTGTRITGTLACSAFTSPEENGD